MLCRCDGPDGVNDDNEVDGNGKMDGSDSGNEVDGDLPNRCRPLRGWKTRPEKERRGRPNRHHSMPAPRERGLIQPFFR